MIFAINKNCTGMNNYDSGWQTYQNFEKKISLVLGETEYWHDRIVTNLFLKQAETLWDKTICKTHLFKRKLSTEAKAFTWSVNESL